MLSVSSRVTDGIRWTRLRGPADDQSLVRAFRQLWTDASYKPDLPEIYDMRHVDAIGVSLHGAARLSRLNQELHAGAPAVRVALLLPSELTRILSTQGALHNRYAGANIQLCRSETAALSWVAGAPGPF